MQSNCCLYDYYYFVAQILDSGSDTWAVCFQMYQVILGT